MEERCLVILEVSQKQEYIFQSNKLYDNIVNSAVIAWIMSEGYMEKTISDNALFDAGRNLVYSGGGHTVLEFPSEEQAVLFTKRMTRAVREEYPGIELFAKKMKYNGKLSPGGNLAELTGRLEYKKSIRQASFHQGSFGVERINTNTYKPMLAGEELESSRGRMPEEEEKTDRRLSAGGYKRAYKFEDLGGSKDVSNFIAVVHIDGNAMGKRVAALREKNDSCSWDEYKDKLKIFSDSIDSQFKDSYKEMAEFVAGNIKGDKLGKRGELELHDKKFPVRRIITAGDDICFVSEGRIGLECAMAFIKALGNKRNKEDGEGYTACAGVAIVHQKYPFYKAYELAEQLCSNAKKFGASLSKDGSGRDVSAIDWHIEFGEVKDTVDEIREEYVDADGGKTIQRPYIVWAEEEILRKAPQRNYQCFKELIGKIQKEETCARGSLKELRDVIKQGKTKTEYFLKFHRLEELIKEISQENIAGLFDAVELMDTFIPLESV